MKVGIRSLLVIIAIVLIIVLFFNKDFYQSTYSQPKLEEYSLAFNYKDNTIYVDYNNMNDIMNNINDYVEYNKSLSKLYNAIIDKYYKSKKVKMYENKKNRILEIKLTKDEATHLFGIFFNIEGDTTVKIYFDKHAKIEEIDLDKLDFKINREQRLRENIVKTALKEVNKTGETYWTWYGYNRRVEWCCVFVSWVAHQNGVLNTHIPKFIWVKKGVDYYREKDQLKKPSEYKPKGGDVIFFEWNHNTIIDHVGLVEKVENGYVYTIEGNVGYKYVKEKKYKINSPYIYAYGVPDYSK